MQLILHLKHFEVCTASPLAVFLTLMVLCTSVCAHSFTTTLIPEVSLISTQKESMTSPEYVNCVERLFRTGAYVQITC